MLSLSGIGIHSGEKTTVYLHPIAASHYIHFRRRRYLVPAHIHYVRATPRCTILGLPDISESYVSTVEHFLAACAVTGWWRGLVVEVRGGAELPILDGSAQAWIEVLQSLGTPPPLPRGYCLRHACYTRSGRSRLHARPAESFHLYTEINFPQPAIGTQRWQGNVEECRSVMSARTFGFYEELNLLHRHGFALGASKDNVLVFDRTSPLVSPRYTNEPARHKALDALGDFFLLGRPLTAALHLVRGSHRSHVALMRHMFRQGALELCS